MTHEIEPTARLCWLFLRPAMHVAVVGLAATLAGRMLSLGSLSSKLPTFARVCSTAGGITVGLPLLAWGINATVTLVLWGDVIGPRADVYRMILANSVVIPASGVGAVLVDRAHAAVHRSTVHFWQVRDASILGAVCSCWVGATALFALG